MKRGSLSAAGPVIQTLRALAADWAILLGSLLIVAYLENPWILWPASLVMGIQLHRLAILGHDGAHRLVWPGRPMLNDAISNVFVFFPLLASVDGYRRWHLGHHARTATRDDPERLIKHGRFYQRPMGSIGFSAMFLGDLVGMGFRELLVLAWVSRPKSKAQATGLVAWWAVAITLVWWSGYWMVLVCYFLGLGTSFWAVFRMRNWSEHIAVDNDIRTHRFKASPLLRYVLFPYNTYMHWEHHRDPRRPWYALPMVRKKHPCPGINSVGEVWRHFAKPPGASEYLEA